MAKQIEKARTTLVFTNVRSQTEYWYNALLSVRPEWEDDLGIHHGSLDRKDRTSVENRLRSGEIKAVVCTSSLDLGVDFSPVEQVIQIGGPKGVARLCKELVGVDTNRELLAAFSAYLLKLWNWLNTLQLEKQ